MITETLFPAGTPNDLHTYGLVMPQAVRDSLVYKQKVLGLQHQVAPVALTDGRWALNARVLTEARPDGRFNHIDQIDPDNLAQVVVIPWGDVLSLLPEAEDTAAKTGVTLP